jgi:hypothetical protein
MALLHQGQESEALFALVYVVQHLLDEKAQKTSASEKASKGYVDSLFGRVAVGVQETLHQCTSESVTRLQAKVAEAQKKIADLRKFVQVELHSIETDMADLQWMKAGENEARQRGPYP